MDRDKLANLAKILHDAEPPKTITARKAIEELLPHIERLIALGYTQKQVAALLHGQVDVADNTLRSYISAAIKGKKGRKPQGARGGAVERPALPAPAPAEQSKAPAETPSERPASQQFPEAGRFTPKPDVW